MIPAFIDASSGRLFTILHSPPASLPARGALVLVPPFAEELNRSRHMLAKTARALAASGWHVLMLDLFGTGDSEGDFVDARWDLWQQDILDARQWLMDQGHETVGLWAMRTGCLLAGDVTDKADWAPLLFWQPVTTGKTFLTQFLRVSLAANLSTSGASGGNVNELRQKAMDGEVLEVAGYLLHPDLIAALDSARLTFAQPPLSPLKCLEISNNAPDPTPGLIRAAEQWRETGADVTVNAVAGPPFWTLQEPEWADDLVAASVAAMSGDDR